MEAGSAQVKKALVALAIETVLLRMGNKVHDEVNFRLYKKHHCYIPDCFENPNFLKDVLQELYGKSSDVILRSIKNELEEFVENTGISNFVTVICN